MTQGYVASFNARTRRGFVQQGQHGDLIPFMVPQSDLEFNPGDFVEFAVVGGKAGLMALNVRPLRIAA